MYKKRKLSPSKTHDELVSSLTETVNKLVLELGRYPRTMSKEDALTNMLKAGGKAIPLYLSIVGILDNRKSSYPIIDRDDLWLFCLYLAFRNYALLLDRLYYSAQRLFTTQKGADNYRKISSLLLVHMGEMLLKTKIKEHELIKLESPFF